MKPNKVGWCVSSLQSSMASVRYRALIPMRALEDVGTKGVVFTAEAPIPLRGLDAVVFVKNFSLQCSRLAEQARRLGKPVILDLCDNIFIDGYGKRRSIRPSDFFLSMATRADAIVVTTEALAEVVRSKVEGTSVFVVPDGLDDDGARANAERVLEVARLRAARPPFRDLMARYFQRADAWRPATMAMAARHILGRDTSVGPMEQPRPSGKVPSKPGNGSAKRVFSSVAPEGRFTHQAPARLLWFGGHGAPHAQFGMLDLLEIREDLERIANEFPVELIVISNNREKYEKHIRDFAIASRYEEWSPDVVKRWLAKASVVLIPNSLDEFSVCKSANRAIHALCANTPVVATPTPAMQAFAGCVQLGSFHDGIKRYLEDPSAGRSDVEQAKRLIAREFGPSRIAESWLQVFDEAERHRRIRPRAKRLDIIIALNLIQDLDLALPVVKAAQARGLAFEVWSSIALLRKSPRVARELAAIRVPVIGIMEEAVAVAGFPRHAKALLTIAETNLGPHRFSRVLTRLARQAGVRSATMQHGLENVGLTYGDDIHPVHSTTIASDRIYLWGELHTLHPEVAGDVRRRCIPVGCTKPAAESAGDLGGLLPQEGPIVGIFENLHWHRYSDEYRSFFLEGVADLAREFPKATFLVKPHHAGMWLTSRFEGERPDMANIVVADPADPRWEPYTASELLGRMDAVITTPSTVALDAARRAIPVAVVVHEMDIDRYEPLPRIREPGDWKEFVAMSLGSDNAPDFRRRAKEFVDATIKPGNAAAAILDDLLK